MIRRQGEGMWLDDQDATDIAHFLQRIVPRGADESMILARIIFDLDPDADYDR